MVLYDGLDQVILSVGLVRPREGVFVEEVKWLLVLTTPVEIIVLAVTFEDVESSALLENGGFGYYDAQSSSSWRKSPSSASGDSLQGDLKLNPTKFAVPTDNVNMLKVVGTNNGRVFMTGRDGSLNELLYQPEEGWFSRKCRKLNHTASKFTTFIPSFLRFQTEESLENIEVDGHRNILYTISASNALTVYDLGVDGEKLIHIKTLSSLASDIAKTATQRFEGLDKYALDIVSMCVVPPTESLNVHLVCITRAGHRLYFSTYSRSSSVSTRFNPQIRPKMLQLLHVRFPPSLNEIQVPNSSSGMPNNMNTSQKTNSGGVGGTSNRGMQENRSISSQTIDSSVSYYHQGLFMCAHVETEERDSLVSTVSDCALISNPHLGSRLILPEEPELRHLDAKVLAIAESPLTQLVESQFLPLVNTTETVARNELAQQHSLPPRQFIVLTNSGLHLFEKTRPLEHLKDLLVSSRGADSPALRKFFADYSAEQACAMCLVVATGAMSAKSLSSNADAFSGTPGMTSTSNGNSTILGINANNNTRASSAQRSLPPNRRDPELVSWATMAFFRLGGRPSYQNTYESDSSVSSSATNTPSSFGRINYSGSHDGFALFLSRLLQPIWASNIFVVNENGFCCRLNQAQLAQLEWHLVRLRHFLRQNQQFATIRRANDTLQSRSINYAQSGASRTLHEDFAFEEALRAEQSSLSNLHTLLLKSLEAISFLSIMSETDLSAVQLSRVAKPKIGRFKFKDLVVSSDPEIVRELINGLTTAYSQNTGVDSGSNMSVEELTLILRTNCPSFFSDTDKIRLKAMDLLFRARSSSFEQISNFERIQLLTQSLENFKSIASDIVPLLPEICNEYQYLFFFDGVVELSLACAKAVDPNGTVNDWYKAGQPSAPLNGAAPGSINATIRGVSNTPSMNGILASAASEAMELLPQLENCYQQIIFVLNELFALEEVGSHRNSAFANTSKGARNEISNSGQGSHSIASNSGSPTSLSSKNGKKSSGAIERPELNENESKQLISRTLKSCRSSTDEVFHIAFYQWFIDHNLVTEMLQQETAHLEPFLRFYCKPLELRMHLLWQFYLHRGDLPRAGHILLQLAEQRGTDQNLNDRLSHLAQSLSLLKASPSDHQLLREVQEKVEVATVQLKIYNELETVANISHRNEAKRQLDCELFTISDLFNQFAKKFGLSESALAILHVSGHQDTRLARKLWETMISDFAHQLITQGPPYNTSPLAETVFNLATEYYPSEYVLPLDFLVDLLEQLACKFPSTSTILDATDAAVATATNFQQGLATTRLSATSDATWYRGWVVNSLLRAQIPAAVLHKLYSNLLEARLNYWIIPEHSLHLAGQIGYILEAWKAELPSDAIRTQQAKLLRAKVDSAIDKHIALVQNYSAPRALSLVQMLRALKR